MLKRFLNDNAGHTALMFGLSAFGILAAVGYSMDYSQIRDGHIELQGQVDAAVLAVAKSGADTDEERRDIVMGSLVQNGFDVSGPAPIINIDTDGNVTVAAKSEYSTMVMGIFGKKKVMIAADATSTIANEKTVEIVMVLDTTASMAGTKMDTLKTSATELVNTIGQFDDADVKIGLVPYSSHVNVGLGNRGASWLEVEDDYTETYTYTYQPRRLVTAGTPSTCTGTETYTYTRETDGITTEHTGTRSTGCTGGTSAVYENDGPAEERTGTRTYTWHGCVGSRLDPLNKRDDSYTNRVPGILNVSCGTEITPLTTNYDQLKTNISAMTTQNNTYMPSGVAWGWRALSSQEPYTEGVITGSNERKIMIVMTDGINTMMQSGENHVSTSDEMSRDNTDDLTLQTCVNAKNAGIEVYTVAFQVPDNQTKQMLERCASDSDHYFDAANAGQLVSAFRSIAARIVNVRLTD